MFHPNRDRKKSLHVRGYQPESQTIRCALDMTIPQEDQRESLPCSFPFLHRPNAMRSAGRSAATLATSERVIEPPCCHVGPSPV